MNLLITGATGFIGGRLLDVAHMHPVFKTWNIVALSSRKIENVPCVLHRGYTFSKEDFYKAGIDRIDAVIHLGGFSPKSRAEMGNRLRYLETIRNTEYLLDHLPNTPERFLFGSTISVYNEKCDGEITEETVPEPATLYGVCKLFCEKLITTWAEEVGCQLQIVRIGNAYGAGEGAYHHVLPLMIQQALRGEALHFYVPMSMRRNYIYVDDICNMMLNALCMKHQKGVINLVSSRHVTMEEVARTIMKVAEKQTTWSSEKDVSPMQDILFSSAKRVQLLGAEQYTFEDGIALECEYFKRENDKK